ncbi:MAG: hypothetical protein ABH857_03410 [Elusimicrobiota bacterium]
MIKIFGIILCIFGLSVNSFAVINESINFEDEIIDLYISGDIDETAYLEMLEEYYDSRLFSNDDKKTSKYLNLSAGSYTYNDDNSAPRLTAALKWDNILDRYYFGIIGHSISMLEFVNFSVSMSQKNIISKKYFGYKSKHCDWILGNYKARFGQGLTFGNFKGIKQGFLPDISMPYSRRYRIRIAPQSAEYKDGAYCVYSSRLNGAALDKKIFNKTQITFFYSNTGIALSGVKTDFDELNTNKSVTINNGVVDDVKGINLSYEIGGKNSGFQGYLGLINYRLSRTLLYDSAYFLNTGYQENYLGFYCNVSNTLLKFEGELSKNRNNSANIITLSSINNKLCAWSVSLRNYDKNYYNPYANAISMNRPSMYLRCRDEKGYRFKLASRAGKISFAGMYDIFNHSANALWDSDKGVYEIKYGLPVTDDMYSAEIFYEINDTKFGVKYQEKDRDIYTRGSDTNSRKDSYLRYKVNQGAEPISLSLSYTRYFKYVDLQSKSYAGESISAVVKVLAGRSIVFCARWSMSDSKLFLSGNERSSWAIKTVYKPNKKICFQSEWTVMNNSEFDSLMFEDIDELLYSVPGERVKWNATVSYSF